MSDIRLIDANALKDEMSKVFFNDNDDMKRIEELIDNAPTVEPPKQLVLRARNDAELEQLKEAWSKGEICFTPIIAYTARPKGEWIEYQEDNEIRYYCSICQVTKGQAVNNFCACCGADMRGGAE